MNVTAFRKKIYAFYRADGRHDLPWRKTTYPYAIFVSEIMLQQTQVARVWGKYSMFLRRFSGFVSLAKAPFAEVLKFWSGLGYNRRAKFLHESARIVVRDHAGKLPSSLEALDALPGIAMATASSIAAFAFNMPVVFIETNIRSVFLHEFFRGKNNVHDRKILPFVETTLDRRHPREWYCALMDYGAMLKRQHKNPSRASAHHARQSAFEGSNRQLRGRMLKILLERKEISIRQLVRALTVPRLHFDRAFQSLQKDELITIRRNRIHLY